MSFVTSEDSTYCELEVYIFTCGLSTVDSSQTSDRHNHWESAAFVVDLLLGLDFKCFIFVMKASQVQFLTGNISFVSYHPCTGYRI